MAKIAFQENNAARFEINRAETSLCVMQSKLEQIRQYLADLDEGITLLKSKRIPIVSIREYRIITSVRPRLIAEESRLKNSIEAQRRMISGMKEELKVFEKPKPTAIILEFKRRAPRSTT